MNSPFGSWAIYLHLIGCYWPTSAKVRWGWWTDEFYWIGSCQLENQSGWPGLKLVNHIWVARKSIGKQSSNHWGKNTRRARAYHRKTLQKTEESTLLYRKRFTHASSLIVIVTFWFLVHIFGFFKVFLVFGPNFGCFNVFCFSLHFLFVCLIYLLMFSSFLHLFVDVLQSQHWKRFVLKSFWQSDGQ